MKVTLERVTERRLNNDKIKSQIQRIAGRSIKGSRGRGWTYQIKSVAVPQEREGQWSHTVVVSYSPTTQRQSVHEKFPDILRKLAETGANTAMQGRPWVVIDPTGYESLGQEAVEVHADAVSKKRKADEPKNLGVINLIANNEFDHIYDRKHQISRIFATLDLAVKTDFQKRSHCLLHGSPEIGRAHV